MIVEEDINKVHSIDIFYNNDGYKNLKHYYLIKYYY